MPGAKPFSEACERNKDPILDILRREFARPGTVLEIGSDTGQHALYFTTHLTHLRWQATDLDANLPGIRAQFAGTDPERVLEPCVLDVMQKPWPGGSYEYAFSANTAHIMGWVAVESMLHGVGGVLAPCGTFCLYGPFNLGGRYTSASNASFDRMLKARDPESGLRDQEALVATAGVAGLELRSVHAMPANNRLLVLEKRQ